MTRYYKWLANDGPVYGTGTYDLTGAPQPRIKGTLKMGERGHHVCTAKQVPFWCGDGLIEVKVDKGDVVKRSDRKNLVRTWSFVRRLKWGRDDMIAYARWCVQMTNRYASCAADEVAVKLAVAKANYAYSAVIAAAEADPNIAAAAAGYAANLAVQTATLAATVNARRHIVALDPAVDAAARAAAVGARKLQFEWIERQVEEWIERRDFDLRQGKRK